MPSDGQAVGLRSQWPDLIKSHFILFNNILSKARVIGYTLMVAHSDAQRLQ